MKKCKTLYLLMAAGLLAACSGEQETAGTDGTTPISLGYTTAEVQTRAGTALNDGYIPAGESVKVLIKKSAASWGDAEATLGYDPAGYDFSSTGGATLTAPATAPTYPSTGESVDLMAYYPTDAAATFVVSGDQTGDAAYKASDLMVASPVVNQFRTPEKVNLQFYHKMAKVVIKLQAGDISLDRVTSVKLVNVLRQVTFTATTGSVTGLATTSDKASSASAEDNDKISLSVSDDPGSAAVFPPQTVNGDFVELTVSGLAGPIYYSVVNKTFSAGHQYTTTIEVNSSNVGLTNAITDWSEETPEAGYTGAPTTLGELYEFIMAEKTVTNYLGWYVASDGTIYPTSAAVTTAGKTAVGIVAYISAKDGADVDTSIPGSRILVIGNTDASTGCYWATDATSVGATYQNNSALNGYAFTCTHNGSTYPAANAAWTYANVLPSKASRWFLPSEGQLNSIYINGVGAHDMNTLRSKTGMTSDMYWTATEYGVSTNNGMTLYNSGSNTAENKTTNSLRVRACFAYPSQLESVTANQVGQVITSDGGVYYNRMDAEAAGKTPVAMIVYVGAPGTADTSSGAERYHGLAIALSDANGTTGYWATHGDDTGLSYYGTLELAQTDMKGLSNTATLISKYPSNDPTNGDTYSTYAANRAVAYESKVAHPIGTSTWFLPSNGQMVKFLNNYGANITSSSEYGYFPEQYDLTTYNNVMNALELAGGYSARMASTNYW